MGYFPYLLMRLGVLGKLIWQVFYLTADLMVMIDGRSGVLYLICWILLDGYERFNLKIWILTVKYLTRERTIMRINLLVIQNVTFIAKLIRLNRKKNPALIKMDLEMSSIHPDLPSQNQSKWITKDSLVLILQYCSKSSFLMRIGSECLSNYSGFQSKIVSGALFGIN